MDVKRCSKCGETKPVGDFYVKYRITGELRSSCKSCVRAAQRDTSRQWKLDNRDRAIQYNREWRRRNQNG